MEFKDLLTFIEIENERLKAQYTEAPDKQKMILARTIKIMEEVGELSNEVLAHASLQRKEKLENYDKENLPEEFADVILTTLILAKTMNVDIENALTQKIEKIHKRYNKYDKNL